MAESIKTTMVRYLLACFIVALLGAFPADIMAGDDCEIVFTPIPEANPDSIKPLISESFVKVALEAPDGQRIIQPGFLINDDGEMITRRSTYINAIKKAITGLNDDTLEVITTISEDALADIIALKIEEPDQDVEPLEPRFFFPDNEEILAVICEPYSNQNQVRTAKVKTHGTDPLYGYITKLYDTPHDSLGGKMAVNYEGRMMGIIRTFKQDSLYANYLFPLSVVHIDGDHRGSEYFITKFSSELSDSAQQDLFEAVQYFWSDDFKQARDNITDLILKYPANPMVLLYSAYCDLYNGDLNDAIGKADEAMHLGHQVAELYYLKSLCYQLMLKPKKAMIEIDSAIELNETFMDARALRGNLNTITGNYESGKDDIDYIQDHREDNPFCMAFKGLMELFDFESEKACRLFNRALERSRSDPRIYYYLTAYYDFENEDKKIEEALRKAIDIIPDQGEPYYYLANYFKAEDENDSAIVYYKMAAENSPYLLSASYALGRIYYDEKMFEEAIQYFENVEDYYPDDLVLLRNLGACYAELEKFDHALMTFKKALKIDSKSQITHYNLGLVYLNKAMHKFAEAHFDTAYALGYRHRNLFFQQGRLYLEKGDTAKAKENYEKLRSISGATATKLHNLIIGRDDYVIDSTMDNRLHDLIDDAKKSLVKVEGGLAFSRFFRVNYGLLFVFSPLEHKWGCVVNNCGDIILQKNAVNGSYGHVYYTGIDTSKLKIPEDSEEAADVFKASENSDEPETPPEVDKSLTNAIADEFVIFSAKQKDTLSKPAKIPDDYPEKGDSVIVFTDPIWEHSDFCISTVLAVNPDPFLEKVIVIQTPFEIDRAQGLVLNMEGELAGFMTSIKIPGTSINFAIPTNCLCRYYWHGRYDPGRYSFEYDRWKKYGDNYNVGQVYLWLGNYDKARAHFEMALDESGARDPKINTYLAYIEWKLGNIEEAEHKFEQVIGWHKNYYDAYYVYGLFLKDLGKIDDAKDAFKKAIRFNEYHAMARYELGLLYVQEDKIDDALDEYEELKELSPALAESMLGK